MYIKIKQRSKEIFSAGFDIISNDKIIGDIQVEGKLGSPESVITIKLLPEVNHGETITLKRESSAKKKRGLTHIDPMK